MHIRSPIECPYDCRYISRDGSIHVPSGDDFQAYLVKDTLQAFLQAQNATVTFFIGKTTQSVSLSLPYAAFDLIVESPLVIKTTRYFLSMCPIIESHHTIGRVFLQEA